MGECAAMAERSAKYERIARSYAQGIWKEANDANQPIQTLSDFLNLVKGTLHPDIYAEHEDVVAEVWKLNRQNPTPPNPAESTIHPSPESEATDDDSCDSADRPPSLDSEAERGSLIIVRPDKTRLNEIRVKYASYKESDTPGSYIRGISARNNKFSDEGDGMVEVQWIMCGRENSDADHIAMHTICQIVDEEQAKTMGMNVDLVLGTDSRKELELQKFFHVRRTPRSLASFMDLGTPHLVLVATSATLSNHQPGITRIGTHVHRIDDATGHPPGAQDGFSEMLGK